MPQKAVQQNMKFRVSSPLSRFLSSFSCVSSPHLLLVLLYCGKAAVSNPAFALWQLGQAPADPPPPTLRSLCPRGVLRRSLARVLRRVLGRREGSSLQRNFREHKHFLCFLRENGLLSGLMDPSVASASAQQEAPAERSRAPCQATCEFPSMSPIVH